MRKRIKTERFSGDECARFSFQDEAIVDSVFDPLPFEHFAAGNDIGEFDFLESCSRSSDEESARDSARGSLASVTGSEAEADDDEPRHKSCFSIFSAPASDAMWNTVAPLEESTVLKRASCEATAFPMFDTHDTLDITAALMPGASAFDLDAAPLEHPDRSAPKMEVGEKVVAVQRTAHNAMERERRVNLRRCFDSLRAVIPRMTDSKAPSLQVLNAACVFIKALKDEEADFVARKAALVQQNLSLRSHVAGLLSSAAPIL
jgi:hypothetical protein